MDLVAAVAESLLRDDAGGSASGEYGGRFRLPFGRTSGQAQLCGAFNSADDCRQQIVIGPMCECLPHPVNELQPLSPHLLTPGFMMTPAAMPNTPIMTSRELVVSPREAGHTFQVETPAQSDRSLSSHRSSASSEGKSTLSGARGASQADFSLTLESPSRQLAAGTEAATADVLAAAVPCLSSASHADSRTSSQSDFSDLPMEFSDIDEPPTRTVASGNERASFTDTHEIPMQLPKMGKSKCVTHCVAGDGKRELALGLRAMVTLDMS